MIVVVVVVVVSSYQFSSLLLLRLLVPLLVDVGLEALHERAGVLRVQHRHQVVDVARRQPQGLDLGQLRVAWNIGNTIPEIGECVVDGLGSPALLLVGTSDEDGSSSSDSGSGDSVGRGTG